MTRPSNKRDMEDLIQLAQCFLRLKRCPGGRLVQGGYVCLHCGHDYTVDGFCGEPVCEDGYTTFDALKARSIMLDSIAREEQG